MSFSKFKIRIAKFVSGASTIFNYNYIIERIMSVRRSERVEARRNRSDDDDDDDESVSEIPPHSDLNFASYKGAALTKKIRDDNRFAIAYHEYRIMTLSNSIFVLNRKIETAQNEISTCNDPETSRRLIQALNKLKRNLTVAKKRDREAKRARNTRLRDIRKSELLNTHQNVLCNLFWAFSGEMCIICCEDWVPLVKYSPCKHVICKTCAFRLIRGDLDFRCPLCRTHAVSVEYADPEDNRMKIVRLIDAHTYDT